MIHRGVCLLRGLTLQVALQVEKDLSDLSAERNGCIKLMGGSVHPLL